MKTCISKTVYLNLVGIWVVQTSEFLCIKSPFMKGFEDTTVDTIAIH